MPAFDVNNEKVIALSANLERLNRSAFPSAVRNTLNRAAFEMKKQVPKSAAKKFTTRQKTFFKRFSATKKAEGFNVNKMVATTGIDSKESKELAQNLGSQELGGMVSAKKLVPHDDARISKSPNKKVLQLFWTNKVKAHDATRAFKGKKGPRGTKFMAAVMSTAKSGKKHMILKTGKMGMLYHLTSVSKNAKSNKVSFKIKKLYSVRDNKSHKVKRSGFMKDSSRIVSKRIDEYFIENAEFQFNKELKKRK